MKVVILAGGLGTRLREETETRPKPLVEVGGRPILWHIMKIYSHFGLNDFVVCLGYKGYMIKEYFANYALHMSDVTIDMRNDSIEVHQNNAEPWRVRLVDTGDQTNTGGRVRRAAQGFAPGETFCMTYGDGIGDINIGAVIEFHRKHGKIATVTAVRPPARFGALTTDGNSQVIGFEEKPIGDNSYINGGFFVLSTGVLPYIAGDEVVFERGPLTKLTKDRELMAFRHDGFWQPMDTLRDKQNLEEIWASGKAPWKLWP